MKKAEKLVGKALLATAHEMAFAVWLVGNMDTEEDKAAWWKDFEDLWQQAAGMVEEANRRGIPCREGFAAFRKGLDEQLGTAQVE
jgi:hypothetical protein